MNLLAFAYACEPTEGSEPGAGWMWARMLARLGDTWVLTRANNRGKIEAALDATPEADSLHFIYVDLPSWARFWKRGQRGLRLYYVLWLVAALRTARSLQKTVRFDLVWHLTLANAWLGATASLVGPPFVLGPVGGGVGPPWRLALSMGPRNGLKEISRAMARATGRYLNPFARLAWGRARSILVQNRETIDWIPKRHRHKASIFPNVVLSSLPDLGRVSGERPRIALFAGRLLGWKGADLAIGAIARLPQWRLLICGTGPDEYRLRRLADEAGVLSRVDFTGQVPRAEVLRLMREEAGVFLFPSLHDEAGWVVVEALASDLPIVCLDRGGPPLLADGYGVSVQGSGTRRSVTSRLATEVDRVRTMMMPGALHTAQGYHIDRRAEQLFSLLGVTVSKAGTDV